jgi:predicted CoA-binding protein
MKKTLVLGASPNPERYAYLAAQRLMTYGHPVVAVGGRAGHIGDLPIVTGQPELQDIDTVTLYLGPDRQHEQYEYILGLHPKRLIFNPGTENPELAELAVQQDIEVVEGCTLVMLSVGTY